MDAAKNKIDHVSFSRMIGLEGALKHGGDNRTGVRVYQIPLDDI